MAHLLSAGPVGNDFGVDNVFVRYFERQAETHEGTPGDKKRQGGLKVYGSSTSESGTGITDPTLSGTINRTAFLIMYTLRKKLSTFFQSKILISLN